MTRLASEALKGSSIFIVGTGLDWVPGDRIALATASQYHLGADDCVIKAYDSTTGEVELVDPLNFYHWG